jgi:arsenate reductase
MNKIYYLSSCSTCVRIIKELGITEKDFKMQDIKTEKITSTQLDELKNLAGSYESLFSRVAMKYRSMGLNEMNLSEKDYKKYILDEYTFLKRPCMIINGKIFIGNSKKNIESAKQEL